MANTQPQLPADIEDRIFNLLLNHSYANRAMAAKELAELFATECATKLHEARQEIESLTSQLKGHASVANENLKALRQENEHLKTGFDLYKDEMAERRTVSIEAIKLLKKFISRHEAGLLPDRFIYDEIKTFLDGAK
jgi:predicted nuclease with TOPRIM domain